MEGCITFGWVTWSEKRVVTPLNAADGNSDGDNIRLAAVLTSGVVLARSYLNSNIREERESCICM